MKTLILVRHAKSSWNDPGVSDIDRPLNDRGKKDAPEMAERLKAKGISIDLLVSSPAKRARKTAKLFAEVLDMDKDAIQIIDDLYLATPAAFQQAVSGLKNTCHTVALFSHNPGITEFANTLTTTRIDDMPTCSLLAVEAAVESWEEFESASRRFIFFDYPKNPS
ncbi:MAG TPA: histidine phosphatase family protein [Flavisolibacter sp.]|jgi:phosphohistidine phosphatase|nr:histidine phosphatase family protein [Flavisolibacter sp.]